MFFHNLTQSQNTILLLINPLYMVIKKLFVNNWANTRNQFTNDEKIILLKKGVFLMQLPAVLPHMLK